MRRSIVIGGVLAIVMAFLATPAMAVDIGQSPTGERVQVFPLPPDTVAADTPFHVWHGWTEPSPSDPDAAGPLPWWRMRFRLYVDDDRHVANGLQLVSETDPFDASNTLVTVRYVHNFNDGLAPGTYTLRGQWTLPCQYAVDDGYPVGPCGSGFLARNRQVVVLEYTKLLTVTAP